MYKKERLSELLHSFLAGEIRTFHDASSEKLKESGLPFSLVTITEVRPSKDYKSAKIYWTMPAVDGEAGPFPSKENRQLMQDALTKKIPLLKRRIAEELQLRFVPTLQFVFDDSAERGSIIDELLKKAGY